MPGDRRGTRDHRLMAPRPKHSPQSSAEHESLNEARSLMGDVLLYRITPNGLGKDNIYARKKNFDALADLGIHDYRDGSERDAGSTRPVVLISPDGSTIVTEGRWYTVQNDRNDARFRITGLGDVIEAGELLALGVVDHVVTAINLSRPGIAAGSAINDLDETAPIEAAEGKMVLRLHRARERDRALVAKKKNLARLEHGALACEACGFTPAPRYGAPSERAIEAHHTAPLASLPADGGVTRLEDLVLLCATCHRLLHALELSADELRALRLGET
jgi:hypothetical protein